MNSEKMVEYRESYVLQLSQRGDRLEDEKKQLKLQVDGLRKWIQLYSDCDCDTRKKPGQPHWFACRRKLADDMLYPDGNVKREVEPLVDQLERSNRLIEGVKKIIAVAHAHADICGCWACVIGGILSPSEKRKCVHVVQKMVPGRGFVCDGCDETIS